MVSIEDRLARPTLPADPVQADLGSQVYYYVCMACHGDQGQGLTPEWIDQWGLEKNACWQSKCHAANHPPEGFTLPRTIPPVVGPPLMSRFSSALELHDYIKLKMPWHAPGTLSDLEYWQLTAFLVRLNGIDPGREDLDANRAALIRWQPETLVTAALTPTVLASQPVPPPPSSSPRWILVIAGLAGLVGLIFWSLRLRKS